MTVKLNPKARYMENTESGEIFAYVDTYELIPHMREYFGHRNSTSVGGEKGAGKGAGDKKAGKPDAVTETKNTLTTESNSAPDADAIFSGE